MHQDWRKRHFGLLVVLAVVLTVGAVLQDYRFDRWLTAERTSLLSLDRSIGSIEVALSDLRAAETGYLATGQGPAVWTRRSTELLAQLEATLTALRDATASDEARTRYDAATAALAGLSTLDSKARDEIQSDQRVLAADAVFEQGAETADRLRAELTGARWAEGLAAEGRLSRLSRLRLAINAAAAFGLAVLAVVMGRPPRPTAASQAETVAQMLRELPPPVKPAQPPVRAPVQPALPVAAISSINLPEAAELCVDLARVMDARDVPALLERAANVLDAKGVIIWTVDSGGTTLSPTLTHGYPGKVLNRLGVLDVEADNVTSLTYRSLRPQTMPGGAPGTAGAIAVPLMTASGCSGVLAAEIRDGRPVPETLAVTKILAAQFATLIGPLDAAATRAVEA
jgi:hypothetical protein